LHREHIYDLEDRLNRAWSLNHKLKDYGARNLHQKHNDNYVIETESKTQSQISNASEITNDNGDFENNSNNNNKKRKLLFDKIDTNEKKLNSTNEKKTTSTNKDKNAKKENQDQSTVDFDKITKTQLKNMNQQNIDEKDLFRRTQALYVNSDSTNKSNLIFSLNFYWAHILILNFKSIGIRPGKSRLG
jgi:hypothetical protein